MKLRQLAVGLCFLGCFWGASEKVEAQFEFDRAVVIVNGDPITGRQYYRRMEFLPNVGRLSGGRFVESSPGFLTMTQLINEQLMLQLARERGVFPTDAQVDRELDARLSRNPELLEGFERLGLTRADLRFETLLNLAEFNIVTQGINVTDVEVEEMYANNPEMFTDPTIYELRSIAVRGAEARGVVDAALNSGRSFADVARELSQESNRGEAFKLSEFNFQSNVREELARLETGRYTEWIAGEDFWIRFELVSKEEGGLQPLTDELKAEIRRELLVTRGRNRNNLPQLMENMRRTAQLQFADNDSPLARQIREVFNQGG